MSKAGQRLLQGAREALEYAKGNTNLDDYRVHFPKASARDELEEGKLEETEINIAEDNVAQSSDAETSRRKQVDDRPWPTRKKTVAS